MVNLKIGLNDTIRSENLLVVGLVLSNLEIILHFRKKFYIKTSVEKFDKIYLIRTLIG